jgi:hypothetical protein
MKSPSEAQDRAKCLVHGPKLSGVESPGGAPEALGINDGGLLDED